MPDPTAYLKAFIAAAGASAVIVLAFRLIMRKSFGSMAAAVSMLSVGGGLVAGYRVLEFAWSWPPTNALNRFLLIVLPATTILELLAATADFGAKASGKMRCGDGPMPEPGSASRPGLLSRILVNSLRMILFALVGPILLHGSVYLRDVGRDNPEAWAPSMIVVMLCASIAVLAASVTSLKRLSRRPAAGSIPISLAMAILSAGITTMLAGYIKGGAAAIPLAAALIGATLAFPLLLSFPGFSRVETLHGAITIGVVGLFSLLCIGRFFGQVTSLSAIVIFLSPLLCWTSEIPRVRLTSGWQVASLRLIAVSIPLSFILIVAKTDFDQKMAPLLATVNSPPWYFLKFLTPAGR
jgi:hypothetical protein